MTATIIETDQISDAAKAGDIEASFRLESDQRQARRGAVDRGFASAVDRGFGNPDYTAAERASIETLVDRLAESPVRARLELAWNLDADLANGDPVVGGFLDRALHGVIGALLPYAETRRVGTRQWAQER